MNKYLTLILSIAVVGACANAVFAFRNDPVWQKERDRLMLQKDYSAVYAKSLETCAPYEKDYNLTELNGTRRINGMKDGFCNETILSIPLYHQSLQTANYYYVWKKGTSKLLSSM